LTGDGARAQMREPLASFSHWRYHDEVELGRDAIESIELLQTAVQVGASGPASATVPFAAGDRRRGDRA